MNFEKISFRPTAQQRAFLERINQRYKCRTITGLMRKLLDEVIAREAVLLSNSRLDACSQVDVSPFKSIATRGTAEKLVLKDTRHGSIDSVSNFPETDSRKERTTNPYLDAFQEIIWLEEARRELERLRGRN